MWAPGSPVEPRAPCPRPAPPPTPLHPLLLQPRKSHGSFPTSPSPSGSIPVGSGSLSPLARPPPAPGDPAPPARLVLPPGPLRPLTAGVLFRGAGEAVTLSPLRIGGHWAQSREKKPRVHSGWGAGEARASSVLGRNCSKTHN